jgi:hypothetical protein
MCQRFAGGDGLSNEFPAVPEGRLPLLPDGLTDALGVDAPDGVSFLARPTLLWLLEHPESPATDCLCGEVDGGTVLVRISRDGLPYAARLFGNTTRAVRWALDLETTLMNQGWTKTI